MIKTKLATYLFEDDSEQSLDEFNAMGTGMVVGYQAPLGAPGVGSSSPLEKAFWRDNSGKSIKTASPSLHRKKSRRKKIKEVIKESPYAEYDNLGIIDFKIEIDDKIDKKEKEDLIKKFIKNEIAFLINHNNEEYACDAKTAKPTHRVENFIHTMEESFGAMHEPDFSGETMPGLWNSLKDVDDPDQPVKTASPLLHHNHKKLTEANICSAEAGAAWGDPNYHPDLTKHGFWRHRKNHNLKTHSIALTKKKMHPKGLRHDLIEDDEHLAESVPEIKSSKEIIPGVWTGLPDVKNHSQQVKTSSPNLRRRVRRGERR